MADAIAYAFLPWVRAGLAAELTAAETLDAGTAGRARLDVSVTVGRHAGPALEVRQELALIGPGEVQGIAQHQIIRSDPRPDATDFEPNFLVQVEFDRPDFPWLFTPAAADAQGRLRPWLVLVVVARGEGVALAHAPGQPLPVLRIDPEAGPSRQLPDLAQSWAWAHAQVLRTAGEAPAEALAGKPERTASRLICPRRLEPDTAYLAAVVPAFEAGRRAGLGLAADPADEIALRPAWMLDSDARTLLPVYHWWRFSTGKGGDFESLARALRARSVPPGVGQQAVGVGEAGPPLPALAPDADGAIVSLRGALVPPGSTQPAWPAETRAAVEAGLLQLLDLPAGRLAEATGVAGPAVTPPVYGRWLAARATVPAQQPVWLRTLNLDPRQRAVAGLGTRIVQLEQERLMALAWAEVGEIQAVNRELRRAQLAREVRLTLLRRHLVRLPAGALLQLTAPAHRRILLGATTLGARVRASALPRATLEAAFRRAVRPRGPLARRLYGKAVSLRPFPELFDARRPSAPAAGTPADGLLGFATTTPARPGVADSVLRRLRSAAEAAVSRPARPAALPLAGLAAPLGPERSTALAALLDAAPAPARPAHGAQPASGAREAAEELRQAVATALGRGEAILAARAPTPRPALRVSGLRSEVLAKIAPDATVLAAVLSRVRIAPGLRPVAGRDPLEEVLAAPSFAQPAWELLRDHFPEHLVAGGEQLSANTATLVETNPAFVEALLVGLNHEMGRELLWREYPTDQRGTCFRRFWAPAGNDDIAPVPSWSPAADLGGNVAGGAANLVLLVRGDLLRRYPSTVIYAAPDDGGRPRLEETAVRLPIFQGRVDPDFAFVGFDLSLAEARSGWWFVLEEQPSEPRFGLDVAVGFGADAPPLHAWNELTWGHLAASAEALAELSHVSVAGSAPPAPPAGGPAWGRSSADMAAILAQQPVRVCLRAADLLRAPGEGE